MPGTATDPLVVAARYILEKGAGASVKVDLDALEKIARGAEQDEWHWRNDEYEADVVSLAGVCTGQAILHAQGCGCETSIVCSNHNRSLIASMSPPVVLALVARIRRLEEELARAAGVARAAGRVRYADDFMSVAQDREVLP